VAKMKHTKESIQDILAKSDRAVARAMIVIYDRQTQDEKTTSDTRHTNQRGFSGAHAKTGSYYARWVLSGRGLTGKHLDKARAMAMHYWRQLLEEAERKSVPGGSPGPAPKLESVKADDRYMLPPRRRADMDP